jgi:hypothetical protein
MTTQGIVVDPRLMPESDSSDVYPPPKDSTSAYNVKKGDLLFRPLHTERSHVSLSVANAGSVQVVGVTNILNERSTKRPFAFVGIADEPARPGKSIAICISGVYNVIYNAAPNSPAVGPCQILDVRHPTPIGVHNDTKKWPMTITGQILGELFILNSESDVASKIFDKDFVTSGGFAAEVKEATDRKVGGVTFMDTVDPDNVETMIYQVMSPLLAENKVAQAIAAGAAFIDKAASGKYESIRLMALVTDFAGKFASRRDRRLMFSFSSAIRNGVVRVAIQ